MYEEFMKVAQDAMKPAMKMVENNTALSIKMMQNGSANAIEVMQGNLEHVKALAETKDVNAAVEMQQKYVEGLNEMMVNMAKENAAMVETAVTEAGKIFEDSVAEVQAQAKKTVENIENEMNKASKATKAA